MTLPVRKSAGKWILPQPKSAYETGEFLPIPKLSNFVDLPFGYKQNSDNPLQLDPIPIELEALQKAKKYLRQYSSRLVAAWLTKVTGRPISHFGLLRRVKSEQRDQAIATSIWSWAARYKKAIQLAERYEKRKGKRSFERAQKLIEAAERVGTPRDKGNNNRGSGEPSREREESAAVAG